MELHDGVGSDIGSLMSFSLIMCENYYTVNSIEFDY